MSFRQAWIVATLLLLLPGCALFVSGGTKSADVSPAFPWSRKSVSEDIDTAPTLKMARLEASIISRPVHDARVRQHVWEELDESGLMSPDIRQHLNDRGFRVGVAGSSTPWALQSLARESVMARRSDHEQLLPDSVHPRSVGPSFSLMQSGRSLIEVQSQLDGRTLPLKQLPEMASARDHTGLKCVVELSVKELNDDWVLLNVLPQIHTGAATTRLSITGASEQLPVRQNVISLYEHQFTVKLLSGEIAVIGRNDSSEWNLGRLFFQPESGSSGSEKLLMIRMAGVDRLKGKSDPSFRLDAYEQ
jgi:hypothetical protein